MTATLLHLCVSFLSLGGWRDASRAAGSATGSDKFELTTLTSSGGGCSCSPLHGPPAGSAALPVVASVDAVPNDECSEVVVVAAAAAAAAATAALGPAPG